MSELKKCKLCKEGGELSSEDIPKWSKKAGNYSPYPPSLTCEEKYNLEDRDTLVEITPDIGDNGMELKLSFGKKMSERWVFYWAPNETKDHLEILKAKEAYGEYENHGLKKTDKKGDIIISVNLPQPYKEEDKTYCRHVHYLVEDKKEGIWSEMKTTRVIFHNSIEDLDRAIKEKDVLIVNALPEEYFKKEKIPNSVNLVYKSLDKLSLKEKQKIVDDFVKDSLKHVEKIKIKVNSKKLDLRDIPIITYCAHSKCNASEQLIDHLFECGYHNVSEWSEGIEGWNKERSFFNAEEDDAEDDEEDEKDEEDEEDEEEDEKDDDSEEDEEDEKDEEDEDDEKDEEDEEDEKDEEDDEDEEEDDEDDEEDEEEEKTFVKDGVKYFYDEDDNVYNEDFEHVGEAVYEDGKIVDIDWLDDTKKQDHKSLMKDLNPEEDEDDEDDEDEDDEEEDEDEKEDEDDEEDDEDEKEDEDDEDEKEDEEEDEEDEKEDEDIKKYEEKDLSKLMNQELRDLIKNLEGRNEDSYDYEIDKTKDKLIDLILNCQGVPLDKKDKKDYYKRYQLENMTKTRIKKIAEKLSKRKGNSYKYQVSTWTKKKLIDLILNCQGDKKEMKGGWSFHF